MTIRISPSVWGCMACNRPDGTVPIHTLEVSRPGGSLFFASVVRPVN